MSAVAIDVNEAVLRPVVRAVVEEVLARVGHLPDGREGFTAAEAAALLGLPTHVVNDARRRGVIPAVRIGKQYVFSRSALLKLLNAPAAPDAG